MAIPEWLAAVPEEEWRHWLGDMPSHLADSGQAERLYTLLTTHDFLQAKVEIIGVEQLIADYALAKKLEAISENSTLQRIAVALRAGIVLLRQAPEELWNQIKGRANFALHTSHPRPVPRLDLRAATLLPADSALLHILQGHTDGVTHCALSADGKLALSSSRDKTLRLWNTIDGKQQILENHEGGVAGCALSADGKLALSFSGRELRLWDINSGRIIRILRGHTGDVTACALSEDGKLALSASKDQILRLWNTAKGETVCFFAEHRSIVTACALSADGKLALSASADGKLCLWNTNSGQRIHIWKVSIFTELADCVLSADGRRIFAVFNPLYGVLGRARLQVWDATTGRRVRRLKGFKGAVVSCALSADGRWALTGSETTMMSTTLEMRVWEWGPTGILALFGLFRFLVDFEGSTLRLWDTESGETRRILRGHRGSVMFCALSADGRLALSASSNLVRGTPVSIYDPSEHQTLRLWDTASEIAQSLQERHAGPIQDCALSADGRLALTCAKNDKTLRLWDTERGTTVCILQGHLNQVGSCALSADGRLALSSATDVSLWNTTSGERRRIGTSVSVPYSSSKAEMIRVACALSSDGKLALSLRRGIGLCLWDTSSGKVLHVLGQANNLDDRTLSADGRKVLTISEDGVMRLWDTASGQEITQWIHNVPLLHCALSADGRRALTTSKDGNLQLWDTDSRRTQPSLEHYIGSVTDCALSADGHLALFACQDTTLRFWNMESGQEIACWTHDIPIVRCGLSANGRIVVAGDIDGGVHFLEVVGATKAENVSAKPYAQLSEYISPDSSTQQSGYPPANPYTQRTLSPHPPQHAPVRVNKPGSGCGALAGLILSICISIWTLPLPRLLPLPWYLVASVGILLIIVRSALERRSISRGGMALASLTLSIIVLVLTLCNFALGVSLGGR